MGFDYTGCEDKNICANCGICCINCGCDYFPSDFEKIDVETVEKALDEGRTSIVAHLEFNEMKGRIYASIMLYLRARNINRPEIDLLSVKTTCASLEENGCYFSFENRPSGGALLKPSIDRKCYYEIDRTAEIKKWANHQRVLQKVVKYRTGKSVSENLKKDVYNIFMAFFENNFDCVTNYGLEELKKIYWNLVDAFPDEYKKALEDYKKTTPYMVRNLTK